MQLLEKRFRVCIILAVCHDPKGTFLQFWYAIPFKAPVCNSELSVFITPSVRDILLAIFVCVSSGVYIPVYIYSFTLYIHHKLNINFKADLHMPELTRKIYCLRFKRNSQLLSRHRIIHADKPYQPAEYSSTFYYDNPFWIHRTSEYKDRSTNKSVLIQQINARMTTFLMVDVTVAFWYSKWRQICRQPTDTMQFQLFSNTGPCIQQHYVFRNHWLWRHLAMTPMATGLTSWLLMHKTYRGRNTPV